MGYRQASKKKQRNVGKIMQFKMIDFLQSTRSSLPN